ncbi:MAG: YiiD C-terminal domain-containing protein [Pseudoxanthomonas suwonensis]|nr:YiiD C-terminal domain-containing protein [Pseudoxanthomonas suwonensis]
MPPVAALQPTLEHDDGQRLVLAAPLAANLNDKGCAFGGSLVSLMTLAGWSLVTLRLLRAGIDADVFVAESQVHYLKPLYEDLRAEASARAPADWDGFIATVRERGRARIHIDAAVAMADGALATRCQSSYAAILRR